MNELEAGGIETSFLFFDMLDFLAQPALVVPAKSYKKHADTENK